jgi:hypothetical protein
MAIATKWAVDDAHGNAAGLVGDAVLAPSSATVVAPAIPPGRPHLSPDQTSGLEV